MPFEFIKPSYLPIFTLSEKNLYWGNIIGSEGKIEFFLYMDRNGEIKIIEQWSDREWYIKTLHQFTQHTIAVIGKRRLHILCSYLLQNRVKI